MAQRAIEGKNVLLEALQSGSYIPFACATSIDFYYDTELIEKATVGMQGFKGWVSGIGEWGLTLSSVTHVLPTTTMMTVFDTLLESLRKIGLDIRLTYQDYDGNLKSITGHVMIPHTGITSPVDQFSEDTIEMKGDGSFAINTTLINPGSILGDVQDPIDFTSVSGGELSLTYSVLVAHELLYVSRDGVGKEVIQVGTPNSKQVKVNYTTGNVSWSDALNPGEWVHMLYK